ncbi:MAG: hypothetical protein ACR65U_08790 [Methylocystis sp.]
MAWDIPNYVALPVGVLLSSLATVILAVYQEKIANYLSAKRDHRLLRSQRKAFRSYAEIRKMKDDPVYCFSQLQKIALSINVYLLIALIGGIGGVVFFMANEFFDIQYLLAMDINQRDAFIREHINVSSNEMKIYLIIMLVVLNLPGFLALRSYIRFSEIAHKLRYFDAFELHLSKQWSKEFKEYLENSAEEEEEDFN